MRSVLIILPTSAPAVQQRAAAIDAALRSRGHEVTVVGARQAASQPSLDWGCVITLAPSLSAHVAGYRLQRRGIPWIADLDGWTPDRLGDRLVLAADALTCGTEPVRRMAFEQLHASATLATTGTAATIDRQVEALAGRGGGGDGLRILMIGPVNSPHMEHLAASLSERGHIVQAGGAVWGGGLPPSGLPEAGIPVSVMTWPQPLWVRRLVRRFQPNVVHANWMPFAAAAALAGARPLVAMAWGSDVYHRDRLQTLRNRLTVRRADLTLADSSSLLDRLVELGAPRERTGLLNWGVDLDRFKPPMSQQERRGLRRSLGLDPDGPVVISPRGFKDIYRPEVAIEAFCRLQRDVPGAQLVLKHLGGDVPVQLPPEARDRIHIVGRVPYERMADYFAAADVCVSIPDTDSSPRSVWEAMACGCTCVLSDLRWVHELIRHEVHALVVPTDPEAVSHAIRRLLTQPALASAMSAAGRQLVEKHRNATREMNRLEAHYRRLASRPQSAAAAPRAAPVSSSAAGPQISAPGE